MTATELVPTARGREPAAAALQVEGLAKAYGATVALRRMSFSVAVGEIHALLGENGAGKSTLVKILSGIVVPDAGAVRLNGTPFRPASLLWARKSGVSTAFQELSLLPNLSIAQNLLLPHLIKGPGGLTSARRNREQAAAILAEFGVDDIAPDAVVGDLSLAQKQRVEIVRALSHRPKLLILDEPTAALAEPEWLFSQVERLAASGVAILYISHRLAEVRRLCRRGTVLRNGESIDTVELAGTQDSEIFRMMVGVAPGAQVRRVSPGSTVGHPAIAVRDLRSGKLHGINFDVRRGEIVGVAALEGQGQRALFRMLAGAARPESGSIEIDGRAVRIGSPAQALHAEIGFVPEERKSEGIFLGLRTSSNISLSILDRIRRLGLISRRQERTVVRTQAKKVDLQGRYLTMDIGDLSGGNQQKALIARVLLSGARNLVLFDPTRGVDVGTKQVIYGVIRGFVEGGGSVLMYSTELSEIAQLAHRCLVLYRGKIVGEVPEERLTEERLVSLATGHGE